MWKGAKSDLSDLEKDLSIKPVLWQFISSLPGKLYTKLEKMLLNSFGANGQSSKRAKFDVSDLEKWPLERFNQIYLSILIYDNKKKLYWSCFWDRPPPPLDGQTDRRTTDNPASEKLRCLSAGGAKKQLETEGVSPAYAKQTC